MKPVDQVHLRADGDEDAVPGDCLRACIASIFEFPLEDVPHFVDVRERTGNLWLFALIGWCYAEGHRLVVVKEPTPEDLAGYTILTGDSPRGDWGHCVVALDGALVHDPHPSRAGIGKLWDAMVFRAIEDGQPELVVERVA